jgi:uncharacterized protein (TIGR01777 family)
MKSNRFATRLLVNCEKDAVYLWHLHASCFSRSLPSWERATVVSCEELPGRQVRVTVFFGGVFRTIKAIFRIHYPVGSQVIKIKEELGSIKELDFQIEIKACGENLYELLERVEYTLSWGWVFPGLRQRRFERRLKRFFEYKHEVMIRDLELLKKPIKPLKILITGGGGLIGSSLIDLLQICGHKVRRLVREKKDLKSKVDILYHIESGEVNRGELEGFDAVVHLWGKSIQERWTKKNKKEMIQSREETTKQLVKILGSLRNPPKVFLCASAVGYYGNHGNEWVDESSSPKGQLFLSQICKGWESAGDFLKIRGARVVQLRFGIVLSSKKGALYEIVKFIRRGIGSILGTGDQYMSWIAIDDAACAIYHAILTESLRGPVNICSPNPVTNREFSKKIALYLKRALGPSIPASILRFLKGDMADELLLTSVRANPKKLLESGYEFRYPLLEDAISHLIY